MWSNTSSLPAKQVSESAITKQQDGSNFMLQHAPATNNKGNSSEIGGSPLMRYKHAVCSAPSGYIYIHGGRFGNLPLDDDIWRFDPHQNTWLQLRTSGCKPPNLQEHTLVEHNERLYLFGGQVSASDTENSFWSLDLLSGEWRSLSMVSSKFGAHLGPTNRRGHSAVIHADSMYIYGGFEDFRGSSNQLWEYNLVTNRWELRNLSASSACQPEPRHSHSAVVHKDSMFVYGGLSNLKPLGDLWRWSWRDKRWFKERTRGQSPGQLHGHTAVQAFDSMFVFGGERNGRPTRGLWRLNLSSMSWQKIRPMGPRPSPTTWHGAIANPLSILDEANYIVQGPDSSSELLPISCSHDSCSSMSENCIVVNSLATMPNQQHRSVNRPTANQNLLPKSSSSAEMVTGGQVCTNPRSSSMLLHQVNGNQQEQARGAKRKSRLSFLRRNRQHDHWPKSALELKPIPTSASDTSLVPGAANNRCSVRVVKQEQDLNVRILDNLDSDIKEMFERAAELSPDEARANDEPMSVDTSLGQPLAMSASSATTCRSSTYYETAHDVRQPAADSAALRASQRTSCASYTTPPSELNTLTEEPPVQVGAAAKHSFLWGADNQQSGFDRRNNRPKSEIVQSLIERADARIKHLYTPYFNNNNNQTDNGAKPGRGRHNRNRHSLDRSKRHTLPQTMTYYNLYFSEDKSSSSPTSSGQEGGERHQHQDMSRDDFSSSTLRAVAKGAALVGVHEGEQSDSNKESRSSLVTTTSSGSRTICADTPYSTAAALTYATPSGCDESAASTIVQPHSQHHLLRPDTAASESCDNTSLSFSVIAEFEEDDMLQYSSPSAEQMADYSPSNHRRTVVYNERPAALYQAPAESESQPDEARAPKSNSSGYDSVSANSTDQRHPKPLGHSVSAQEDSSRALSLSPAEYTTTETSPEQSALKSQLKKMKPNQSHAATTASSTTADSLLLTSDVFDGPSSTLDHTLAKSLPPSSPPGQGAQTNHQCSLAATRRKVPLRSKLFSGTKQKAKTRYWQLCMFVIGGKQGGAHGVNEPITIWRLYI